MLATKPVPGPLKTHGGKHYLARKIVPHFLPHRVYTEPFAGGLAVLRAKEPVEREVASDLNLDLIRCWSAIKTYPQTFQGLLNRIPYAAESFEAALAGDLHWVVDQTFKGPVEFFVRSRMSRGGLGKSFAWSERLRGGKPGDLNAWLNAVEAIPEVSRRVANVQFLAQDFAATMHANDCPEACHYLDPPYLHETRTARKAYDHEMDRPNHLRMLATAVAMKGQVVISGYRNPLYDEALAGWTRVDFEVPNHSGQGKTKQRRVESLWKNR